MAIDRAQPSQLSFRQYLYHNIYVFSYFLVVEIWLFFHCGNIKAMAQQPSTRDGVDYLNAKPTTGCHAMNYTLWFKKLNLCYVCA